MALYGVRVRRASRKGSHDGPRPKARRVLVEFAHTLGTDFSIQGILDHLVLNIVDVLSVSGAGEE